MPERNNINVAMRLQVIPQSIPLLCQLINHKDVLSVADLLFSDYEASIILYRMTLVNHIFQVAVYKKNQHLLTKYLDNPGYMYI